MEKICLDYGAALDFLRGEQSIVEKLKYYANREEICLGSMTLVHLLETVRKQDVVMNFSSAVTVLPFQRREAIIAARIKQELSEKGEKSRGMESMMTAATCLAHNAFLFTKEPRKFEGIKGLKKV
jgi:predicted nucleic acid-binding protein